MSTFEESSTGPKFQSPARIGILISGRGSNCLAIAQAIRDGRLNGCEIGVIISNVTGALGIESARRLGLPVVTLEGRGREQRDHEDAISALLRKFRIDLVCMAGTGHRMKLRTVRRNAPGNQFIAALPQRSYPRAATATALTGAPRSPPTVRRWDRRSRSPTTSSTPKARRKL